MKARWPAGEPGMHSASMGTSLLQQAVRWGLLLGTVTVLTVLFSFLGTITCAVLGGMMFGTMRHRR
jgi:hypothetical protein